MKINLFNKDTDFIFHKAGHAVFHEGDEGDKMYAVIDGVVDIIIKGKLVEKIAAGGVFGEMALIESRARVATAMVSADAKLVPVDRRRFEFLVQQSPFFAIQLMTIMAGRLRRMDETITPFES